MKKNVTELVFILDRSGSMSGLENDTIGGFNATLNKQKAETGDAIVTTVLFDNEYELLHDRINIQGVAEISDKDYQVRGTTALLDAIEKTIQKIKRAQKHTLESERPETTMFVIITDGEENSSRKYSENEIKKRIKQQEEQGWQFIFLAANIDAVETAEQLGIQKEHAVSYFADARGVTLAHETVSCAISEMRESKQMSQDWRKKADKDFNERNQK